LFTQTELDWWLAGPLLIGTALYLLGMWRLKLRGDHWPVGRSVAFLAGGIGTIAFAGMSGLGSYDDTVFSVHMVQHMMLAMVAPIFLAMGAPITLALRTTPSSVRAGILRLLHSRFAQVVTFPLVGWGLFVCSPFALYFTDWYPATLRNDVLHELLHLHFVLVGCLFFWPMVGIDPIPGRVSHPFRFLILVTTLPFHAILGLAIYTTDQVIAADHYYGLKLAWLNPASDQKVGGGLLWSSGELVGLLMLAVVGMQWMRASEREGVREDRRLDRIEAEERVAAARVHPLAHALPGDADTIPAALANEVQADRCELPTETSTEKFVEREAHTP
jgi:putative copper resistance protein D